MFSRSLCCVGVVTSTTQVNSSLWFRFKNTGTAPTFKSHLMTFTSRLTRRRYNFFTQGRAGLGRFFFSYLIKKSLFKNYILYLLILSLSNIKL